MVEVEVKFEGAKYIERALKELGNARDVLSVLSSMLNAGAKVIGKDARRRAPRRTGDLAKKIHWRKAKSKSKTEVIWKVISGARQSHLVEFGTAPRRTKKGAYRGHVPANPFMRKAYDNNKKEVIASIEKKAWQAISKKARKRQRV